MSRIPFEEFLASFTDLKARVNSNPQNLRWRAANDTSLAWSAFELHLAYRKIAHSLAVAPHKWSRVPSAVVRGAIEEYKNRWNDAVSNVGLQEFAKKVLESLEAKHSESCQTNADWSPLDFDPVREDAAKSRSEKLLSRENRM